MDLLQFSNYQLYAFFLLAIGSQFFFPNNKVFKLATYLILGMGVANGWVQGVEQLWSDTVMPLMGQPVSTYQGVTQWQFLIPIGMGLVSYLVLFPKYFWITRITIAIGMGIGMGSGFGRNIASFVVNLARMSTINSIMGSTGLVAFVGTIILSYYFIFVRPPRSGPILTAHNSIRRIGYFILLVTFAVQYGGWITVPFEGMQKMVLWFKAYLTNYLYIPQFLGL